MNLHRFRQLTEKQDAFAELVFYDEPSGTEVPVAIETVAGPANDEYLDIAGDMISGRVIILGR